MDKLKRPDDRAFTLIEILVVIAVIGILAAIAVGQYSAYQKRGFTGQVQSDLKNASIAEEAYFASNHAYKACDPCNATTLSGFATTANVRIKAVIVSSQVFRLTGSHNNCGADVWTLDNVNGTIVDDGTPCQ